VSHLSICIMYSQALLTNKITTMPAGLESVVHIQLTSAPSLVLLIKFIGNTVAVARLRALVIVDRAPVTCVANCVLAHLSLPVIIRIFRNFNSHQ
jgi:hypothetical protein